MASKGTYLMVAGIGAVFLWSGLRGKKISDVLRNVVSGGPLSTLQTANVIQPISGVDASGNPQMISPVGATGNAIADLAMSYQGHCYSYGGAPGPSGQNCWDCSSFVNWVLTRVGDPVPGGNWDPSNHGPNTLSYIVWTGARTIYTGLPNGAASIAQPGDLIIDASHMGIAIGNGQMVSALNSSLGTKITSIKGVMFAPTWVKRL